jgi:large subunit ribosomal protein L15
MKLNKVPKTTITKKKRVGRGYGSGKGGHTVGRGAKGLKARSKVPLTFTGTKIKKSFLKKLPLQRGKGRFKSLKPGPVIVNLKYLNLLPKGSEVDLKTLIKHGLVEAKEADRFGVKILGEGALTVSLKVKLPCSKGAIEKIEKAGGKVAVVEKKKSKGKTKQGKKKPKKPLPPKAKKKKSK